MDLSKNNESTKILYDICNTVAIRLKNGDINSALVDFLKGLEENNIDIGSLKLLSLSHTTTCNNFLYYVCGFGFMPKEIRDINQYKMSSGNKMLNEFIKVINEYYDILDEENKVKNNINSEYFISKKLKKKYTFSEKKKILNNLSDSD